MNFFYNEIQSPVGKLKLVANEKALVAILWQNKKFNPVRLETLKKSSGHEILQEAEGQLQEYFAGQRKGFKLPLNPHGTEFQKKVWQALSEIPFGQFRSYGEIAKAIGHPKSSRAVGAANGKNPISIVIPCHRVIGASLKLTGFAGGLQNKSILLRLENHSVVGDQLLLSVENIQLQEKYR